MSDGRSSNNDPSMDDILASIRKIISDDEARAQVGEPLVRSHGNDIGVAMPAMTVTSTAPKHNDVLLLTDPIDENLNGASPQPEAAPIQLPPIEPVRAPEMTQPSFPSEPLVGSSVAGAATSAFDRLNQAMQEAVPPPTAAEPGPALGAAGGKTIEELVQDMLRPMLKDWLERNLPPIVERYVEREVVRLTRR